MGPAGRGVGVSSGMASDCGERKMTLGGRSCDAGCCPAKLSLLRDGAPGGFVVIVRGCSNEGFSQLSSCDGVSSPPFCSYNQSCGSHRFSCLRAKDSILPPRLQESFDGQ